MSLTWYGLAFPSALEQADVLSFVRSLAMRPRHGLLQQADPAVFEIVATGGKLRWQLGLSAREAPPVLAQLRAALPGVRADRLTDPQRPAAARAVELKLNTYRRQLRTDTSESLAASILTALHAVGAGEALALQWLVGPWLPRPVVKRTGVMREGLGPEQLVLSTPLDSDDSRELKAKSGEPLLGVVGRIAVLAEGPDRQRQLVQRVLGALQLTRQPGVGLLTRWVGGRRAARRFLKLQRPIIAWPCPLSATELTTLLGWPIGNPTLLGVAYRGSRQLPPPAGALVPKQDNEALNATTRVIGRASFPGSGELIQLRAADARHHLHCIGPTGSGKSTVLGRIIESDLLAGRGLVVIEPKSDLIADVLDRIPESRIDDVVLLDPTDHEYAVGLNVLAPVAGDRELVADQIVHLLQSLYQDSWGPRTADILHSGLLTLVRSSDMTICELPLLLTDANFRRQVLQDPPDPLTLASFWSWFGALRDTEKATVTGPSLNKLRAFTQRRAIRSIIGQANTRFRMEQVFTERKVLLVNLAKGLIGPEAARLLGSLVLASFWQTTLGRSAIPAAKRAPVMLFIDEFQDYVQGLPLDFGDLLGQARGLGVGLTVAHQVLQPLDRTIKAGVLTNARSRIVFQTGSADAKALAQSLGGGLTADDLQALGRYEAYAVLMTNGEVSAPMSLETLPPTPSRGTAERVRARSRELWARPISEVDANLLARRQTVAASPPATTGRRPRSRS